MFWRPLTFSQCRLPTQLPELSTQYADNVYGHKPTLQITDNPQFLFQWGLLFCQTRLDRLWRPSSHLFSGYRGYFPGVKRPGSELIYSHIPIYIQQDATLHNLFIYENCSTCFGWYLHPSSGAHTTVSTASGICHTVTATCRYRGRVGTGLSVLWEAYATHSTLQPRKDGARSALFLISELCCSMYCLCRLCCSMYCLCVNVYCTTTTGC